MTIIAATLTGHTHWEGSELLTFFCTYPRKIHAQVMSHRSLSRNAQSSRAMRVSEYADLVSDSPVHLVHSKRGKGMQPSGRLQSSAVRDAMETEWLELFHRTLRFVRLLDKNKYAKEEANRFLEPFAHIKTLITCTRSAFDALYALRKHGEGAQGEFSTLVERMREAIDESTPLSTPLHVPHRQSWEASAKDVAALCTQVAWAARLSFYRNGDEFTSEENVNLIERLATAPVHASPFEHVAYHVPPSCSGDDVAGNFRTADQLRAYVSEGLHWKTSFEYFLEDATGEDAV
jgi:thymidylate synthase ThyX